MADVLIIDSHNFRDFPPGGNLSFVRQLMRVYGDRLALVGFSTDSAPAGRWSEVDFPEGRFSFFNCGRITPSAGRPHVPRRIHCYRLLRRHRSEILARGVKAVFFQSPEGLIAAGDWGWRKSCYIFHGVSNPLEWSRYRWARPLAPIYDYALSRALDRVDCVLACADQDAIDGLIAQGNGRLGSKEIVSFPTRVDTEVFFPVPKLQARARLGIGQDCRPLIVSVGRMSRHKGWDLVLNAFGMLAKKHRHARLIFVGDGEDRRIIEEQIARSSLAGRVAVTGFESPERVALYLNAADVCAFGSRVEGWPISVIEALACGKPVVSAAVSGARRMIADGQNGFVPAERDPAAFADALERALDLPSASAVSLAMAESLAVHTLARDLGKLWEPLA